MMRLRTAGENVFAVFNYILLSLVALVSIFPIAHVLALSFSSSASAASGKVVLLPVEFTLMSYRYVIGNGAFQKAFGVSLTRVALGLSINTLLALLTAYPLSRVKERFAGKPYFTWFFLISMIFSGGLIPWYIVIERLGLLNSIWALVLPGALPMFNCILLMNYFHSIPSELEDAAAIDGAGHWATLWQVLVPMSAPVLATIALFSIVSHWNSWFDGLILMNSPDKYPLQSYLQTIIINRDPRLMTERDVQLLKMINEKTTKSAQIIVAMLPIMAVYPFLQKHFTTGIMLGAVKG